MSDSSLDIGSVSSVGDVEFVERLGVGVGAGRFRARLPDGNVASLLLADPERFDKQGLMDWARRLNRVDHPGVPGVLQIEDVLDPGFVAQRYIEGETLADRIARLGRPLAVVEGLALVLQAAAAMRAAHRAEVPHGALSGKSVLLEERNGAMDAVRVVGWRPLTPGMTLERAIALDLRSLGELLYLAVSGVPAPAAVLEEPVEPGAPYLVDFGDLLEHWTRGGRGVNPGRAVVNALAEARRVDCVDAFVDALLPEFARQVADAMAQVAYELSADREFKAEVKRQRERRRELESKLRFIKDWLRDNAPAIEVVDDRVANLEGQERSLRNLEVELAMLLDRPVRPGESLAATAGRRAPPPEIEHRAPDPVTPGSAEPEPDDEEPTEAPAPSAAEPSAPTVVRAGPGLGTMIGVALVAAGIAGVAVWLAVRPSEPGGVAPGSVASAASVAGATPATAQSAAPKTAASVAPKTAASVAPKTAAPETVAAPVTEAVPLGPPPPGMVLVTAGSVQTGLTEKARDVVLAQCRADTKEFPKATAELCTPEALAAEVKAGTERVPAFYLDRLEVSQLQYDRCVSQKRCKTLKLTWDLDAQPATGVTWEMARDYCEFRGARLPTRSEWLRAARGDDGRVYPWGDAPPVEGEMHKANYGRMDVKGPRPGRADGHKYAAPVGVFAERGQSPAGLANMGGNVREWTRTEEGEGVIVAGGGWRDLGMDLRVTRTQVISKELYYNDLGIRCAVDVPRR